MKSRTSAHDELGYRSLRAEIALLLQVSEYQTEHLMDLAYRAAHEYPLALAWVESGKVTLGHLQVIADAGVVIGAGTDPATAERRREYEARVLEAARTETPNRLKPIAKNFAEEWSTAPIEERHKQAVSSRSVRVVAAEDGMADLYAHLPADVAYAIHDRLTRVAKSAKHGERIVPIAGASVEEAAEAGSGAGGRTDAVSGIATSETSALENAAIESSASGGSAPESAAPRTRDQLRADAFTDLLLSSDPFQLTSGCPAEAIDARIQFLSPIEMIEGASDDNAGSSKESMSGLLTGMPTGNLTGELTGYGPIGLDRIRESAAEATHFDRITTDFHTGEVLSVNRYRPSEEIRRRLGARDRMCRFPGCRVPAHRCDLDHTIDAAYGGPTSTDNLSHLCRGHHTLKHHSDWNVEQVAGGVLRWTSPAGRTHIDRPPGAYEPAQHRRPSKVRFEPADEEF